MSRTIEDIQKEYNEAALKLGAESYAVFVVAEELQRVELKAKNLQNRMLALTKEANKLRAKQSPSEAVNAELVQQEEAADEQN